MSGIVNISAQKANGKYDVKLSNGSTVEVSNPNIKAEVDKDKPNKILITGADKQQYYNITDVDQGGTSVRIGSIDEKGTESDPWLIGSGRGTFNTKTGESSVKPADTSSTGGGTAPASNNQVATPPSPSPAPSPNPSPAPADASKKAEEACQTADDKDQCIKDETLLKQADDVEAAKKRRTDRQIKTADKKVTDAKNEVTQAQQKQNEAKLEKQRVEEKIDDTKPWYESWWRKAQRYFTTDANVDLPPVI